MTSSQTVFVVDDEEPVRKALRLMLETSGFQVETFPTAQAFLDTYRPSMPGCLILDVRMPGMDGMQLLRELAHRDYYPPIIMLTAHGDIPMAVDAIQTGAIDFLEKPAEPAAIQEKVTAALAKDAESRRGKAERDEIRSAYDQLTPREREVLELLVDGKSTKTIATVLGTAESTVRLHRSSIFKKMRADSVPDLINLMSEIS